MINILKNRQVYCEEYEYHFFEDYLNSLEVNVIFKNPETCKIFVHQVPDGVCINDDIWLINTKQATRPDILKIIGDVRNIYDYSEENIEILRKLKPEVHYLHVPYIRNPKEITCFPKTKWFAMINNNCDRRFKMVSMMDSFADVTSVIGWNNMRDNLLFEHKILINVHFHEDYIVTEQLEINRCVYNKMIVISETSKHQDKLALKDKIIFCDYDDIPRVAKEVMRDYRSVYKKLFGCTPN